MDGDTWEAVVKFKLVDTATGDLTSNLLGTFNTTVSRMFNVDLYFGSIIYPRLSVSSNGTSWDIAMNVYDSTYANTLTYGSEYLIKVYFDGISYNLDLSSDDGLSWVNCIKVQSTTKIYNSSTIGFVYETSSSDDADIVSIDLNKSYIKNDGNIIWKNNFGGNKSGIFEDVIEVDDGYIVCGKDALNYGLLVKYDFNGERVWIKNYANTDTYGMSQMEIKDDILRQSVI